MTTQSPTSYETIKLKLIQGNSTIEVDSHALNKEGIQYLIKALAYADDAFSREIEDVLLKSGVKSASLLIKGLHNPHSNVRAICAMVLIRLGHQVENQLQDAYRKLSTSQQHLRWIYEFIFEELTLPYSLHQNAPEEETILMHEQPQACLV